MNPAIETSRLMTTAAEIWDFFVRNGGLDTDFYDVPFERDVRKALGLPNVGELRSLLTARAVSTEDFVVAFFQAADPFAQMMSDLLRLFERAAAQQGKTNVAIEFDFGDQLPQLDFDLRKFRQWLRRWQEVRSTLTVNVWDLELLWQLASVIRPRDELANPQISSSDATNWLGEYEGGRWPAEMPAVPQCRVPDLDERLRRVWQLWTTVVRESTRFGETHDDLRSRARLEPEGLRERNRHERFEDAPPFSEPWPASLLNQLNGDRWAADVLTSVFGQAELIAGLREPDRMTRAKEIVDRLDELFSQVETRDVVGTKLMEQLDDFLSLPIWKRRHELFSAWVSTQILESLELETVRVHQYGGVLEFAFTGTHVATLDSVTPRLHLWAEMRSPLAAPVGKGRKTAIQPDYSLVADPVTNPLASLLEVECKQYRRPSPRNFSAALTDYARGRPNATIVLVNYGPVSDEILPLVADEVRQRTHVLGNFRPGNHSEIRQFRRIVADAVTRHKGTSLTPPQGSLCGSVPEKIVLRWGREPSDLDLHLFISTDSETTHVFFSQKGSLEQRPWAALGQDFQTGNGPEEINISRCIPGRYRCYVHKYGGSGSLAQSSAIVELDFAANQNRLFRCPTSGIGDWWHVFTFDVTGSLQLGEGIAKDAPSP